MMMAETAEMLQPVHTMGECYIPISPYSNPQLFRIGAQMRRTR